MSNAFDENSCDKEQEFPLLAFTRDLPAGALLTELLCALRQSAVTVWDRKGDILLANQMIAHGVHEEFPNGVLGRNIREFAPSVWAEERILIANQAIMMGEPISLLEIQCGRRNHVRFIPLNQYAKTQSDSCVLITIEGCSRERYNYMKSDQNREHSIEAQCISLGRLGILTNRELEVLALMGEGMRSKEIAARLCRSVSTVENHRENLGVKLDVSDRSRLVAYAENAVLQVEDAMRTNIRFDYEPDWTLPDAKLSPTHPREHSDDPKEN